MDIVDTIYSFLPAKRKQTPSGWTKFNAVCCTHNGSSADTRQRAGLIRNGEGASYHCFNCGFKASYQNGRQLTRKMKQLLGWLGAPDDVISKLALDALRTQSESETVAKYALPDLTDKALPKDSKSLLEVLDQEPALLAVDYVVSRGLHPFDDYNFQWSPELPDRLVIPFTYQNRTVGWTARKLTEGKPKYLSDQTPGYVFNLDAQKDARKFVIVVEGPMDAISIDGVAILGAGIMDKQAMLINRLNKQVILVPDRDKDGERTIEQALALGWAVSMPEWEDCKDVNDAHIKYGRIKTLTDIVTSAETSAIKIKLRLKSWLEN